MLTALKMLMGKPSQPGLGDIIFLEAFTATEHHRTQSRNSRPEAERMFDSDGSLVVVIDRSTHICFVPVFLNVSSGLLINGIMAVCVFLLLTEEKEQTV